MRATQTERVLSVEFSEGHGKLMAVWCKAQRRKELGVSQDELMVHRADLHSELCQYASTFPNIKLVLSCPVRSLDPQAGAVYLEDGTKHHVDLIVGADGVHSATLRFLSNNTVDVKNHRLGMRVYRFLVPYGTAMADPSVAAFMDSINFQTKTTGVVLGNPASDHLIICYPCRDGELINLISFKPDVSATQDIGPWFVVTTAAELVREAVSEDMPEYLGTLFSMGTDVKRWTLLGRECPSTFHDGRLVLIGDAAHPTHPKSAAGASLAIEDGGTLGVLFQDSAVEDYESFTVQVRLALFQELRYERCLIVKYGGEMMRGNGLCSSEEMLAKLVPGARLKADLDKYLWCENVTGRARTALENR